MRLLKIIDDIVVDGIPTLFAWLFWIVVAAAVLGPIGAGIVMLLGLMAGTTPSMWLLLIVIVSAILEPIILPIILLIGLVVWLVGTPTRSEDKK